jgi:hypothetical protein
VARSVFHECLGTLQLQICIDLRRLGLGEIGRLLIDCSFVGVRLDAKQQIASLDHLPFGEIALADKAGHTRHDIDLVESGDAANKIAGFRHLAAHDGLDRDRRRQSVLRQTAPQQNAAGRKMPSETAAIRRIRRQFISNSPGASTGLEFALLLPVSKSSPRRLIPQLRYVLRRDP